MLDPSDRTTLTEYLRAPDGYKVDRVIATTFTLDLIVLLTWPLSLTLQSGDAVNQKGRIDPIALLESLRRYAGRMHVFCDAGHIKVPRRIQRLFGFLEDAVIEVSAPRGGKFHPKVTIVRYVRDAAATDADETDADVRYRVLCGSRNLTFDRSWDTMLALDGPLTAGRRNAYSRNRPLADFTRALPGLARRRVSKGAASAIDLVAGELERVAFEPPPGFDDALTFWPLGLGLGREWPFPDDANRMLAVAPFVDKAGISLLREAVDVHAVVSRQEALDDLPDDCLDGTSWYVFHEAIEADAAEASEDATGAQDDGGGESDAVKVDEASGLRGLHTKFYVADIGWASRLWTGSANVTGAAFNRNVEFLVELSGRRKDMGVSVFVDGKDDANRLRFSSLLTPYRRPTAPDAPDEVLVALEEKLARARAMLVKAGLRAVVTETTRESATAYDVSIEAVSDAGALPDGVECHLRPISIPSDRAQRVGPGLSGALTAFKGLAFESLSGFCAVTATASQEGRQAATEFVLCVPLHGAPEDRQHRLLLSILSDKERLLRYLLMLLEGPDAWQADMEKGSKQGGGGDEVAGPLGLPLLEPMLRTLATDPTRLEPVQRLVKDLTASDEGRRLLPEEFMDLWSAIGPLLPASRKDKGDR